MYELWGEDIYRYVGLKQPHEPLGYYSAGGCLGAMAFLTKYPEAYRVSVSTGNEKLYVLNKNTRIVAVVYIPADSKHLMNIFDQVALEKDPPTRGGYVYKCEFLQALMEVAA